MRSIKAKKQPKETDAIRAKLENYAALQRKIDNQIERLATLGDSMDSPSTPNLTGMPSGGSDGISKTERQVIRYMELNAKIDEMINEEQQLRQELDTMIDSMTNPNEQTVIQMRYLDGASWGATCAALFGSEPDYDDYEKRYQKRTFKIHGSALQALARIYRAENEL